MAHRSTGCAGARPFARRLMSRVLPRLRAMASAAPVATKPPTQQVNIAVVSHKHLLHAIISKFPALEQRDFSNAERRTVVLCDTRPAGQPPGNGPSDLRVEL
jgi:broad specificity phosphatase PhoE